MNWQYTIYVIPSFVVGIICFGISVNVLRDQKIPGFRFISFLLAGASIWSVGYGLELLSTELASKVFWDKIQLFGGISAPLFWFFSIMRFTKTDSGLNRTKYFLLSLVPFVVLILGLTNELHRLYWSSESLNIMAPFPVLDQTYGVAFYVHIIYSYSLLLVSTYLLILHWKRTPFQPRLSIVLLFASFVPWIGSILDLIKFFPIHFYNITPLSFCFIGIVLGSNASRFRRRDIVPVARKSVIESMTDMVIVLDNHKYIVDINRAARDIFGEKINPVGQKFSKLISDFKTDFPKGDDKEIRDKDMRIRVNGEKRIYHMSITSLGSVFSRLSNQIIVMRDITEHRKIEDMLKESLKEKETLLQEIHHRVKNNLQTISSLLSLQTNYIQDKEAIRTLRESENRIQSIALVHEHLYQSEDLRRISFREYVVSLMTYMLQIYRSQADKIKLNIDVEDIYLGLDAALSCGLIVNELVSNSLKYAFPGTADGEITIEMRHEDEENYILKVEDTGIGVDKSFDLSKVTSLGLQLVLILVEQLNGTITLDGSKGMTFCILFPIL